MIRGMGASKLGMAAEQTRSEVIANNLANVNTPGFKRSVATGAEFEAMLLRRLEDPADNRPPVVGLLGNGATVSQVSADGTQGQLLPTQQPLDFALEGPGRFMTRGPNGETLYTRNGAFHQIADGTLVTTEGHPVLIRDANGELTTLNISGGLPQVQANGTVSVGGQVVGTLAVDGATGDTRVLTGALESANVELAKEMTDLIVTLRSFQINQRAMTIQDQTLGKAVTELGKV